MKVLVTGACGFVGGYLLRELLEAGHDVVACDTAAPAEDRRKRRTAGGCRSAIPVGVVFRACDVVDYSSVRELVHGIRPDAILHLAALSSAAASLEQPRQTIETNIVGTLNVLESVRALAPMCPPAETVSGKVRVVSIGSSEEYGVRPRSEMPLRERSPIEPVSPYAVSKAAQTMLTIQYARAYGLDTVATRSFGHTGPGQPDRFVLPAFARQCAEISAGRRPPRVRVGRIDVVRDYLDVRDVVRAYRLILERGEEGSVYNVCSGQGLALKDALSFFIRIAGKEIGIEEDPRLMRPADIPLLVGDNEKLRRECGFERTIDAETMLGDLFSHWQRIARES